MMLSLNSKNTYIFGCSHFSHSNIIKYCNRPFSDVSAMNDALWSGVVSLPNDSSLIHLGDFSFGRNAVVLENWYKFFNILSNKNIICHFIFGNHDKHIKKYYTEIPGWSSKNFLFHEILEFTIDGIAEFIVASHYPMEDWNGKNNGSYHIHCHTHKELESSNGIRRIHGGVDTIGFQPILVKDLLYRI